MQIEPLSAENAAQAYAICKQSHPIPWSFKVFTDCLDTPYWGFQLNDDGNVLGYYIALSVVDEVTLMDIAVGFEYRGKGYAKDLLAHCLSQASSQKAVSCWLEVRQSNQSAINLYNAFGFKSIETRKGYYQNATDETGVKSREDALVMQCIV